MNTGNKIICDNCHHRQSDEWQFCHNCLANLHYQDVYMITPPSWVGMSKSLLNKHGSKMDAKGERKMQDMVEYEKKKELKNSDRARRWEEGRKREWKANKPFYMRKYKGSG